MNDMAVPMPPGSLVRRCLNVMPLNHTFETVTSNMVVGADPSALVWTIVEPMPSPMIATCLATTILAETVYVPLATEIVSPSTTLALERAS